uniref:Zgc:153044 n=1 Tax=Neogobius melanostomus TaxID=47308 RepID=A0A8C6WDV2_9GOBI
VHNSSGPVGLSGLCQITEHLFISNAAAANDASQVAKSNITCIINVSETTRQTPPPTGVEYIHIPASDSPTFPLSDHFDTVADKVQSHAENNRRTLVHCNAGVSRSAALCMVYLVKHQGASLLEAHTWIKKCRPMARPNNGFWRQLIRYESELRGSTSVQLVFSSMGEIPDIYEDETRNMTPL